MKQLFRFSIIFYCTIFFGQYKKKDSILIENTIKNINSYIKLGKYDLAIDSIENRYQKQWRSPMGHAQNTKIIEKWEMLFQQNKRAFERLNLLKNREIKKYTQEIRKINSHTNASKIIQPFYKIYEINQKLNNNKETIKLYEKAIPKLGAINIPIYHIIEELLFQEKNYHLASLYYFEGQKSLFYRELRRFQINNNTSKDTLHFISISKKLIQIALAKNDTTTASSIRKKAYSVSKSQDIVNCYTAFDSSKTKKELLNFEIIKHQLDLKDEPQKYVFHQNLKKGNIGFAYKQIPRVVYEKYPHGNEDYKTRLLMTLISHTPHKNAEKKLLQIARKNWIKINNELTNASFEDFKTNRIRIYIDENITIYQSLNKTNQLVLFFKRLHDNHYTKSQKLWSYFRSFVILDNECDLENSYVTNPLKEFKETSIDYYNRMDQSLLDKELLRIKLKKDNLYSNSYFNSVLKKRKEELKKAFNDYEKIALKFIEIALSQNKINEAQAIKKDALEWYQFDTVLKYQIPQKQKNAIHQKDVKATLPY